LLWTPDELTPEQVEALRRLREVESPAPERVRSHKGLWSRVKEAFSPG